MRLGGAKTDRQAVDRAGIKLLFQHNPSEPIGVWHSLEEDTRGLFVRGRLLLDVARAREIHALMRVGRRRP